VLASYYYSFPSQDMVVIGVTGTKGKSTVVNLAGRMLEEAGYKVGWISSLSIKIGAKESLNPWHMTMPGRFKTRSLLRRMEKEGCEYALLEVTSEGIKQWRHWGLNLDTVCFTNLAPEHLEAHGGFEAYKRTKGKIFKNLTSHQRKRLPFSPYLDQQVPKVIIANRDDKQSDYYLGFSADKKFTFGLKRGEDKLEPDQDFIPASFEVSGKGIKFRLDSTTFECKLLGKFNLYNALSALAVARSQKVDFLTIKKALAKVKGLPGRMEFIDEGQDFEVIVDLAHTPDSFEAVMETVKETYFVVSGFKNCICVFGAAGGGRDRWKRPKLGEVADKYCDKIILTNEDPYKENPDQIIADIAEGIENEEKVIKIKDRRKAIGRALEIADEGDIVLILGKGTEANMVVGNKRIPWDEREVTRACLQDNVASDPSEV
ncbi:MAG TPA: UDP-N-acetylmuramoyl-L-alanyl-D-glutamate--2,6-diaminopimelate ligase, partial [Patescibacteria group bacterium]|nr:UDP-N-acetylmuramoyl-L-alanyl-D-glutamate--2,6-diaminopimelate ligase [Patescibacteria group bacterium]